MSTYGQSPNAQSRQRRVERYAGEFLNEPSMSAARPIPGETGAQPAVHHTAGFQPLEQVVQAQQQMPQMPAYSTQPYAPQGWQYPQQPQHAPQGWQQPYQGQPVQQTWQQPQPQAPQGWGQMPQQTWQQPGHTGGYVPPAPPATPVQPIPAPGGGSGGTGGSKNGSMLKLVLLCVVLGIALGVGVFGIQRANENNELQAAVAAYDNVFNQGVYVDDIHLGGMTREQATVAVQQQAQQHLSSWSIDLTYNGQLVRRITASDLGMTVNVDEALDEAWSAGRIEGTAQERLNAMNALQHEPYNGYTAMPSGDTSVVDGILQELAAPVYRAPVNATVTFVPEAHSYPFEYTGEVYGTYLDIEPVKAQIYTMVEDMESGSIELTLGYITPEVTVADLKQYRTLRGSATTDVSTTSTEARTANIQRAFEIMNGYVIKPGKSFSFNSVVGARTKKNGFQLAIEYAYGKEREGYGGGVCQASTTVYLAAVRAHATITKREPHSDKVNYTEYGLDATVNMDGKVIDLVFRNDTAHDMYVMAYMVRKGGRWVCHVDIYGEALPTGVTYELVAETVEVLPAPVDPEYVEDETGEHVTYIDDKPVQKRKASDGYVVETFIVEYHDGVEVNRTYVARDTYKAKAQQFWVGVQER